jgi:hypothetical protein
MDENSTLVLFSLSPLNKFSQNVNLRAPYVANAFQILCSTPVILSTNLGNDNNIYNVDLDGNITFESITGLASNCDKETLTQMSSTSSISNVSISLIQPSPLNNQDVYDIILKLYYI